MWALGWLGSKSGQQYQDGLPSRGTKAGNPGQGLKPVSPDLFLGTTKRQERLLSDFSFLSSHTTSPPDTEN